MKKLFAIVKCILYAISLVAAQYLVAILMILYKVLLNGLSVDDAINAVFGSEAVAVTYLSALLLMGMVWLIAKICRRKLADFVDWGQSIKGRMTYACVLVGIGGNFWTTVVMSSIFSQDAVDEYNAASGNMSVSSSLMALIGVAVLVPIMEEVIFRGIILNRLSVAVPVELAIILQGIAFGMMHGDVIWISYAVFMGLILGYIKVCTNSLKASVVTHMAYNIASPIASIIGYSFMGVANASLILLLTGTFLMISGLISIYKYQPPQA